MPQTHASTTRRGKHTERGAWLGLATSLAAVFMQLLDTTIVNVALPSIAVDLGASVSEQLLMVSGYILAFACTLITAARLGDMLGRRRVFLTALALFVAASALCGIAQSPEWLIVARALQGLAAGSMSAQTFALIAAAFPQHKHTKVFGIYGATMGLATMSGPLLGGLLINWDLYGWGWRLIFYINVPLGLAALALGLRYLIDAKPEVVRRLDVVGAGLSAIGLFLLIYPLVEGRERGWPPALVVMLAASLPVLAAFVLYERWLGRRGGDPVLRVELFTDRAFSRGAVLVFLFFGTLTTLIFTITLTLQFGFGFSALRAGLTTLPWAVGTGIAAIASAMVYRRIGNLVLPLGMALLAGSLLVLESILLAQGTDPDPVSYVVPLLVGGVGLGLFVAPLQSAIVSTVRPANAGSVSGLLPTVQQVGSSIGLALIGVVFFNLIAGQAAAAVESARPGFAAELEAAGVPTLFVERVEGEFVRCATAQLSSSTPMEVPADCVPPAPNPDSPPAQQQVAADALDLAIARTRDAAGEAFLQAQRRVLWIIAAIAGIIGLGSLTLPRRNPTHAAAEALVATPKS